MNRQVACALAALACTVGLAGNAQAVPIRFEFSGLVTSVSGGQEAWLGQRATGLFLIETDNFTVLPTPPPSITWTDVLPFDARPEPISALLSIGEDTISLNAEVETYGGIHFFGTCDPGCFPGWRENWAISGNSQSFPLGSPDWVNGYSTSSFTFTSVGPSEADFIPASGLTPLDILTLPLGEIRGNYNFWEYSCIDGSCTQTGVDTLRFVVDSVSRTVVEPTPVPEPGTV